MSKTRGPKRSVQVGDRFYDVLWNRHAGTRVWWQVSDLWFDPVKGWKDQRRGQMAAIQMFGQGRKRAIAVSTLAGGNWRRVESLPAAGLPAWLTVPSDVE